MSLSALGFDAAGKGWPRGNRSLSIALDYPLLLTIFCVVGLGLVGVRSQFDAAGLATASHLHLGLHDHGAAELFGGGAGLGRGTGGTSVGDRYSHAGEQGLPLVLEEIHGAPFSAR